MITGTFDVVGATGPTQLFASLDPQRLAHGYLFAGADGVGKRTFARRLAQSLLCQTPKPSLLGYCGHCSGCAMIASGTHPDLMTSSGTLKIGDRESSAGFHEGETSARDLVRHLGLHAYAGGWRIFIFEDVEFTREAANALLKFFEEPPARVLLLLTTSTPGRFLATIRSRLIEVRFSPLSVAEVASILVRTGVASEQATSAAAASQGSVSRARSTLHGESLELHDAAAQWFFDVLAGREVDDSGWALRASLEDGLDTIKMLTRDWLVRSLGSEIGSLSGERGRRLASMPPVDPAAIAEALAGLSAAQRLARTNVTPHLVAETARMALAALV